MALRLYNTKTRATEPFTPIEGKKVRMYSCGPTVYNYAHIGNFRAYIVADLLKRYLKYRGYQVRHVMNITDIDDKTIRDSQKEGKTLGEFTRFYTKAFFDDLSALNIVPADVFPRATDHIKEMLALIASLESNGHTYSSDASVYYRIASFPRYGELARLDPSSLKENAQGRLSSDEYGKEDARDFALWKGYEASDGDISFDSPYGRGRPGWHIECSAMSMAYLGESFDIHTGGVDLIFPHHTNEIAQSEGATEKPFVRYWVHNEHLIVEGRKMSKSLGNFYTLRDLLDKGYSAKAIRYVLLATHYRQKLNFTLQGIDAAASAIGRLQELYAKARRIEGEGSGTVSALIGKASDAFASAMDDDLHIAEALAAVFEFVKEANKVVDDLGKVEAAALVAFLEELDSVLGVLDREEETIPPEVAALAEERKAAREKKDFQKSDELRDRIASLGYTISDEKDGGYALRKS